MDSPYRNKTADLDFLNQVRDEPERFELFALLRRLEAIHQDKPRLGESLRLADDPVYLRQRASMVFAPAPLAAFTPGYGQARDDVQNYAYGVFGPNGPLPLHLTEYAYERHYQDHDGTFEAFADIFHHRLISLLYRAWANAEPAIGMDRPQSNMFDEYLGAMAGYLVPPERRGDQELYYRLYYAGLFALETRPADALESLLSTAFGSPFEVTQFSVGWLSLRPQDQFALGSPGYACTLGMNTCLGARVPDVQHKFRVAAHVGTFTRFCRLLPETPGFQRLQSLVREYVGLSYAWDFQLQLPAGEAPSWELGCNNGTRLGWSLWLGDAAKVPVGEVSLAPIRKVVTVTLAVEVSP